jgi:hypothetical protein
MNITYTAKAKDGAGEFSQFQRASAYLEELAGPSGVGVTATWDRTDDGNYLLRLSDWCGEVSEQFAASELRSAKRWRWPLLRLWGDLLENRSHKLFDKLVGAGELAET